MSAICIAFQISSDALTMSAARRACQRMLDLMIPPDPREPNSVVWAGPFENPSIFSPSSRPPMQLPCFRLPLAQVA